MTNYVDVSSFPRQLPLRVRVGAYKLHGGCHSRISCRLQAVESMLWSMVMAGGSYYEDQVDNLLRATIILQQFCRKRWWSCLVTGRTSEAVFAGHTVFLHDTDELSDWAIGIVPAVAYYIPSAKYDNKKLYRLFQIGGYSDYSVPVKNIIQFR